MAIINYEPEGKSPTLQTIHAKGYVAQRETGVRWSVATANYGTFTNAFDGVPYVWTQPYIGAGSVVGTSTYNIIVSNRAAGSFRHESDHPSKQFRYYAEYFAG